jgi:hypothetical protein
MYALITSTVGLMHLHDVICHTILESFVYCRLRWAFQALRTLSF